VRTTKKTKAKKSRTRKSATRKPARKPNAKRQALAAVSRAQLALLGHLEALGLLDRPSLEKLEKKAAALGDVSDTGFGQIAGWDRALGNALSSFEAQGGDPKQAYRALVAWQNQVVELPETREGITTALRALKKVVPYSGATLFLRKADQETVEPWITVGFEVQLIGRVRFAEGLGFSSWVATRKKPVLYSSLHRNEAPSEEQVSSFLSVPLVVGGECVGVLNLGHSAEEMYDQGAQRTLILAGDILAGLVLRFLARRRIASLRIEDPRTRLATASYLRRRLEEEVVRCRELGHSMSLIAFRINELGDLTEQLGSEFGERCRQELAAVARAWRQPTELVGLGEGNTLLAVLPGARAERAQARAEALQAAVQGHNFPRRKRMTLKTGVGTYPSDAEDSQELLECVDKALCEADRSRDEAGEVYQPLAM
jgi:diguanylate cyclase (GGDEF)-like protein